MNGTNTISLSLPLGAIYYWIMRKTLRKKKEKMLQGIPSDNAPQQPEAPSSEKATDALPQQE